MASLANTHALFGFTSPRTLEKIIPEVQLLTDRFGGTVWNKDSQIRFFGELLNADFYEDGRPTNDHDFAARDRITRAPKALGFVSLIPTIELTPAGVALLADNAQVPAVITRQLLKFQLPSPYHTAPPTEPDRFAIRPYLELLRLVRDAGSLSKTEVELFFLPLTRWTDYDAMLTELRRFRQEKNRLRTGRAAFVQTYADQVTAKVYHADIAAGRFGTRQGRTETLAEFIAKKQRNGTDYADAFIRYLRATQLVTVNPGTFHVVVSPLQIEEVDYLLATVDRNPVGLAGINRVTYEAYLFDPDTLRLLQDDAGRLRTKLSLLHAVPPAAASLADLQAQLATVQQQRQAATALATKQALQHFGLYDEVEAFFERITSRQSRVPDAPLWLEWNIWRALTMLNYALSVRGNYVADLDGIPVSTAPGKQPDLEVDYGSFKLIVEVTLSSGQKQYDMEGEPVARHYADAQRNASADVPVYCLFIAPVISAGTLAHFFNLNKNHTDYYGGKTKIVPLSLPQFRTLLARGKAQQFSNPSHLERFFSDALTDNQSCHGENAWQQTIDARIQTWLV